MRKNMENSCLTGIDIGSTTAKVVIYNGKVVLERNAEREKEFSYFSPKPGIYTVYLSKPIDGHYKVISNVVSYEVTN